MVARAKTSGRGRRVAALILEVLSGFGGRVWAGIDGADLAVVGKHGGLGCFLNAHEFDVITLLD